MKKNTSFVIATFLILALVIYLFDLNQMLFQQLNQSFSLLPDLLWIHITVLGNAISLFLISYFFVEKHPKLFVSLFLSIFVGIAFIQSLKSIFMHPRPPALLSQSDFHLIGEAIRSRSFPSGHTATAFIFSSIMLFSFPKNRNLLLFYSLAFLVALSRIAVGVHWPIDILIGASLGILIGFLVLFLSARLERKYSFLKWRNAIYNLLFCFALYVFFFYKANFHEADYFFKLLSGTLIAHFLWVKWKNFNTKEE